MEMAFRNWFLQNELVNPGEPPPAMNMDDMIRKGGGGAMLTGTAPAKPWDSPPSIIPPTPKTTLNNPWQSGAKRQIARRLKPLAPTGKFMAKPAI